MSITITADNEDQLIAHLAQVLRGSIKMDTQCLASYAKFVYETAGYDRTISPDGKHTLTLPDYGEE